MEQARYSFLGWMRRGLVGLADGQVDATGRLKIPLELDVIAEGGGARSETVRPSATIYGAGDVSGVDPSAIVRVVPAPGVRDFEANYLCAVEFFDEDFPWRYTPQIATGQALAPWLWVVALADGEFARLGMSGKLPVIEMSPAVLRSALPDPSTTAAWAHVQIDALLDASGNVDAARAATRQLLDADPNVGCSRLICPRRLAPETHYTAFLIPAFERGRLAGLGSAAKEIDAVAHDQPSWAAAAAVRGALQVPVYHEWEFTTTSEGSFEDLAYRLQPVPSDALDGDVLIDLQEPGWNLHYRSARADHPQPGAAALPTALRVPRRQSAVAFGSDPADARLAADLRTLLSAGDSGDDDDPFVLPPRYGSSYRAGAALAAADTPPTWYEQTNLDPTNRAIAGAGATSVIDRQETYIDRIWERLRSTLEMRGETRRWQLSLHASMQLYTKRIAPLLAVDTAPTADAAERARRETQTFRALAVATPMHTSLDVSGSTLAATLRATPRAAAFHGGFTKLTRAGGPLMRRFSGSARALPTRRLFEVAISVFPVHSALSDALTAALDVLGQPALRMPPPQLPPNIAGKQILNELLRKAGLAGFAVCETAVAALQARLAPPPETPVVAVPPAIELIDRVRDQLQPSKTIPARMRAVLDLARPEDDAGVERIDLPAFDIELPDPMYRVLAERTPELIVPGLANLPENSVTMLDPDPGFIDAFMLGVNDEITRELLWREVPVPLATTVFRQFWDVRDNALAIADPQSFRDIVPIVEWGNTALGAQAHRPAGMRGALTVVVVRGDLLRKYPNTEVFMQPAQWVQLPNRPRLVRRASADDAARRSPLFSARVAADVTLFGFQLDSNDAIGDRAPEVQKPGWYFALKERAGDVHFGLDLDASATDPSWPALGDVEAGACIDTRSASFRGLPRYGASADRIAAMLYQRPFTMYVHASHLLHRR